MLWRQLSTRNISCLASSLFDPETKRRRSLDTAYAFLNLNLNLLELADFCFYLAQALFVSSDFIPSHLPEPGAT